MTVSEVQIEQLFRSLGERFERVHSPAFSSLWSAVRADMSTAERALMGEDISELVAHLDELSRTVHPVSEALSRVGPQLTAHADKLAGAFGEDFLAGAGGGAGGGGGGGGGGSWVYAGTLVGLVPTDFGWYSLLEGLHRTTEGMSWLRFLSPAGEDGMKLWDRVSGVAVKLPDEISAPVFRAMDWLRASDGAGTLAGIGTAVKPFAETLGAFTAGWGLGTDIHDVVSEGWTAQNFEGFLDSLGNVAGAVPSPWGLAIDGAVHAGVWGGNVLANHFGAQALVVDDYLAGIPHGVMHGGSVAVHDVEGAWNTASQVTHSGLHDAAHLFRRIF